MTTDIYYAWLLSFIETDESENYTELLELLYYRAYIWMVPQDANRAEDGIDLRARFEEETGVGLRHTDGCSVLEMLIALAIRCSEIMGDPREEDQTWYWFWLMVSNLRLDIYTDEAFDDEKVEEILDIFMTNQYERDGTGGLFYVKNFHGDMRKLEIWYQMCHFLNENF